MGADQPFFDRLARFIAEPKQNWIGRDLMPLSVNGHHAGLRADGLGKLIKRAMPAMIDGPLY